MKLAEYLDQYRHEPFRQKAVLSALRNGHTTLGGISKAAGCQNHLASKALEKLRLKGMVTNERRVWRLI